jgi:hypothetical protein
MRYLKLKLRLRLRLRLKPKLRRAPRASGLSQRRSSARALVLLDEDAFSGTFLGGFDYRFFEVARYRRHPR